MRLARLYVLLHPDDCDAPHGLDLSPGSRDIPRSVKPPKLSRSALLELDGEDDF